jgi:hypothetical protein
MSMVAIRLGRIPDRTPVRIAIAVPPELAQALNDYSDFYAANYGRTEPLGELIPAMLAAFLESDREFIRSRKVKDGGK